MFFLSLEIAHLHQISRIEPEAVNKLQGDTERIIRDRGGHKTEVAGCFSFPSIYKETIRSIIDSLTELSQRLSGKDFNWDFTLILTSGDDFSNTIRRRIQDLKYQVPYDRGIWIDERVMKDVESFMEYEKEANTSLFKMTKRSVKNSSLLDSADEFLFNHKLNESLKLFFSNQKSSEDILLIFGASSSEKRLTTRKFLNRKYEGKNILSLKKATHDFNPFEPFIHALRKDIIDSCVDHFTENERVFLDSLVSEKKYSISRDRFRQDFIAVFSRYLEVCFTLENFIAPILIVPFADSFSEEMFSIINQIGKKITTEISFTVILIFDTAPETLPFAQVNVKTLNIKPLSITDINDVKETFKDNEILQNESSKNLLHKCSGDLFRLFYYVWLKSEGESPGDHIILELLNALDKNTFALLYVISQTSFLVPKSVYLDFFQKLFSTIEGWEERLNRLILLKLVDEDEQGYLVFNHGYAIDKSRTLKEVDSRDLCGKFAQYLHDLFSEGFSMDLIQLFIFMVSFSTIDNALRLYSRSLEYLMDNILSASCKKMLSHPFFAESHLKSAELEALQNIQKSAQLGLFLIKGEPRELLDIPVSNADLLITSSGQYHVPLLLKQASYFQSVGDNKRAMEHSKSALYDFQKQGYHKGEALCNIILAQSFLSMKNIRSSIDHLEIARRISSQITNSYSLIASSALEALSHFLYGDYPRAEDLIENVLKLAEKEGRIGWQLFLLLLKGRILFEYGGYRSSADLFTEGRDLAEKYNFQNIKGHFQQWYGRSICYCGDIRDGEQILEHCGHSRQALYFRAEASFFRGNLMTAIKFCKEAQDYSPESSPVQGEGEIWRDGYSILEGRLSSMGDEEDTLGKLILSFILFLECQLENHSHSNDQLRFFLQNQQTNRLIPYKHFYLYVYALSYMKKEEPDMENYLIYLNQSVAALQGIGSRFSNQQKKKMLLNDNLWNEKIMNEARKRKFI